VPERPFSIPVEVSSNKDPAKTYGLNVLASAVGRMAIPDKSDITTAQSSELFDHAIERLDTKDIPEVPHTSPELLMATLQFDERLIHQLRNGSAGEVLRSSQVEKGLRLLSDHQIACRKYLEGAAKSEMLIDSASIAQAYQLPNMWVEATLSIEDELQRWGKETTHPDIPVSLKQNVSADETRELITYVRNEVLGVKSNLMTSIYTTGRAEMYHLFWTPTAEGLDYTTPGSYDRATQLSFDIPHNVAHLTHLDKMEQAKGVFRYTDTMAERAFFESVAVLSERIITNLVIDEPKIAQGLAEILKIEEQGMSPEELRDWIIQDRSYEFKLRTARLYADFLIINGATFEEAAHEISDTLGLPFDQVSREAQKYLPWTGLGAVYTQGYRHLLESGVETITAAIHPSQDVVTTWNEFRAQRGL